VTHYDTLKVTQDAPIEVISAAYKALARIYHPDRNGSDPQAMVTMQNLNMAYKILSDPLKRAEHDLWIQSQQRLAGAGGSDKGQDQGKGKSSASGGNSDFQKADKAAAEAAKWTAWADKAAQEAKEAKGRAEKALSDLAKAKTEDRPKWEAWVARTEQEAKVAKEKADKAAQQSAKAVADALEASARAQSNKTGG
jgi:DnaJ-class molecular chaperone